MKYLLSFLILITTLNNCKKPKQNDDNLLLGLFFLSQRSNFEFQFVGSNSSSSRYYKNTSNEKILNMQGIPIDEYGDGTSDGFQDKFGNASSVSLTLGDVYFWKKGNIPHGQETTENADFIIDSEKQWQPISGRDDLVMEIPPITISKTNEKISKYFPQELLSGEFDRIAFQIITISMTFDSDVLEDTSALSIVETSLYTPIETHMKEASYFSGWNSLFFQKCKEGSDYNLLTCPERTDPVRYPVNLHARQQLPVSRNTGFFTIGGNEYESSGYINENNVHNRKILGLGGDHKLNRSVNSVGYFRDSINDTYHDVTFSSKMYVMPITIDTSKESYSKLKIKVNAARLFHWDSNSSINKFKPHRYPDNFKLYPSGRTIVDHLGELHDVSGKIDRSDFLNYPETCKPNPRPGRESETICYRDDQHPSIVPDFNSAPWSDNQEAPNPAIGKDMNIYLPAMYAELEKGINFT
ncbi:MAG: hypothetical protein MH321_03380 [Leptospiraceae bacterium]|nr:hypothetical protein [Leptospiraceae bacterium]